jgi:hypothetical protein
MIAFDNTTLHLHPLPPSPLVRHWPSLRDDCLRHLCRRRVRSETQHPGVPVGHSFIVHPASHRRGNGRALGRLPLYNIAAAGVRSETQHPGVPDGHSFTSSLPSQARLAGGPGDSTGSRLCLLTPMGVARNIAGWLRETAFPLRRWTYPEPAHLS